LEILEGRRIQKYPARNILKSGRLACHIGSVNH
jgi:hypothetical protein